VPAITVVEVLDGVRNGHGQLELRSPQLSIQEFDLPGSVENGKGLFAEHVCPSDYDRQMDRPIVLILQ